MITFNSQEEYDAFIAKKAIEQGIVEPVVEFVKGKDGEDGHTPTEEELLSLIEPLIPEPIKGDSGTDGKNGITPVKGVDYYTPSDKEKLMTELLAKIVKPKDGISPKVEDVVKLALEELDKKPIDEKIVTKGELVEFLKRGGFRGGAGKSPLTTKGDILGHSTVDARIPVGSNTFVLTADSTQALGVKWSAPATASPGGSSGAIQYNNSGVFGGSGNATLDSSGNLAAATGSFVTLHTIFNTLDDGGGNVNILGIIYANSGIDTGGGSTVMDFSGNLFTPELNVNGGQLIIDGAGNITALNSSSGMSTGHYDIIGFGTVIDDSRNAFFNIVETASTLYIAGGSGGVINTDGSGYLVGGAFQFDTGGVITTNGLKINGINLFDALPNFYYPNGTLWTDGTTTYYRTGQIQSSGNDWNFYGNMTRNGDIIVDSSSFLYAPVGFKDKAGSAGTTGQVLTSLTGTGTAWLSGLVVLKSTGSINGKTVANTSIYTVPTGRTLIVTGAVIRCTAASSITIPATAGIGTSSGSSNLFAAAALTSLTATTTIYQFDSTTGASVSAAAASSIFFNLTVGATGTSQTLAVDLIGYLI